MDRVLKINVLQMLFFQNSLDHKKLKTLRILNSIFSIDPNTKRFLTRMAEYNLSSLNSIFKLTGWKNFLKNEQKTSYIHN